MVATYGTKMNHEMSAEEKVRLQEEEKEMLEDLITAAVNQALQKAQARANEEMGQVTGGMLGGLNLPGNFKMPGM